MNYFLRRYNLKGCNFEKDKWIDIAFPVVVASIVFAMIIPGVLIQLLEKLHINFPQLIKIIVSLFSVQLIFIIPVLIAAAIYSTNVSFKRKLDFVNWKSSYILEAFCWEIAIFFPLWVLAALMYYFITFFGLDTSSPITKLLLSASGKGKIIIFLVSVFMAPVVEEIIFRRVIFTFVNKLLGVLPAILLTSFAFGALHGGLVQLLPLTMLGIILQILYLKHSSLYPSILLHGIHNFLIMSIFLAIGF